MCQAVEGLVSVIIPAYNLERYIGNTLESVINQEYKDIEILVINDGSTDGTQAIIEYYQKTDSRIRGLSQSNGGAAKARNYGISESRGEFITFLDGDDMLSSDAISTNVGYLNEDPDLDWVSFSIVRVDKDNNAIDCAGIYPGINLSHTKILSANEFIEAFRTKILSGVCCGAIYRKNSIEGLRFPEGEYYEDSFFFTRLLVNTSKGLISPHGSYRYLFRTDSSQLQIKDAPRLRSELRCELERLRLFRERFPENEDFYKKYEREVYYYLRTAYAKGIPGAEAIFKDFLADIPSRPKVKLSQEFKLAIYRVVGYDNIKSLCDNVKLGRYAHIGRERLRAMFIGRRQFRQKFLKHLRTDMRVVVLAPHPDDEVFGCGGLIARLVAEGWAPYVVVMSGGGWSHRSCCNVTEEEIMVARRGLTRKALAELGLPAENLFELDYPDGNIGGEHPEQEARLRGILGEINPDAVLVPHHGEGWPDHLAVRELGLKLAPKKAEIYEYCVWMWYYRQRSLDWDNAACLRMTSEEHAHKLAAIKAYISECAPCGKPWVGVLPELFVKANSTDVELFFKLR